MSTASIRSMKNHSTSVRENEEQAMRFTTTLLFSLLTTAVSAEVLLDPMTRDEDISLSTLNGVIKKQPDGKYQYNYTLVTPATAKGTINSIKFDTYCEGMPDLGEQDIDDLNMIRDFDRSRDGRHVPIESSLLGSQLRIAGFNRDNEFMMTMANAPGHTRKFALNSPNAPGYIHYQLTVSSDNEHLYDYWTEDGQAKYPNAPRNDRWEIHGVIKGPVCLGRAATPMTRPIFDGQKMKAESRDINSLLQYEVPGNRNRWHVAQNINEVKFRIYYSYFMDETTFKVLVNGVDQTNLFHPDPGANEYVTIPLQGNQTLIEFSVVAKSGYFTDRDEHQTRKDYDQFEIRK